MIKVKIINVEFSKDGQIYEILLDYPNSDLKIIWQFAFHNKRIFILRGEVLIELTKFFVEKF